MRTWGLGWFSTPCCGCYTRWGRSNSSISLCFHDICLRLMMAIRKLLCWWWMETCIFCLLGVSTSRSIVVKMQTKSYLRLKWLIAWRTAPARLTCPASSDGGEGFFEVLGFGMTDEKKHQGWKMSRWLLFVNYDKSNHVCCNPPWAKLACVIKNKIWAVWKK